MNKTARAAVLISQWLFLIEATAIGLGCLSLSINNLRGIFTMSPDSQAGLVVAAVIMNTLLLVIGGLCVWWLVRQALALRQITPEQKYSFACTSIVCGVLFLCAVVYIIGEQMAQTFRAPTELILPCVALGVFHFIAAMSYTRAVNGTAIVQDANKPAVGGKP